MNKHTENSSELENLSTNIADRETRFVEALVKHKHSIKKTKLIKGFGTPLLTGKNSKDNFLFSSTRGKLLTP